MALGDELAVLTACDDELYVLIGARALCVQCARTRTLLRKSVPRHVVLANISALPRHVVLRISAPTQRAASFTLNKKSSLKGMCMSM